MNSKTPYKIENINLNNIRYTNVKSGKNKTIVYIKYNDNDKMNNLVFQTPTFININNFINKNKVYEIDVPLHGKSKEKIDIFINFLNKLDNKILNDAKKNNNWFDNFLKDNKTTKYQKIIRKSENNQFKNGMIRIKLLQSTDFESIIQVNNKNNICMDDIPKDSWIKMILEVYGIWITEQGLGLFIRPIIFSFKTRNSIGYDYILLEESEEEVELDDIIHTVNDNSIFIKKESELQNDNSKTTTTLDFNYNSNSFQELTDAKIQDKDSSSSTTSFVDSMSSDMDRKKFKNKLSSTSLSSN